MKKIKYYLVFFIFYSGFLTSYLYLFERPVWLNILFAAVGSLLMVLVFYLFDRYRKRKPKEKAE